MRNYFLVSLLFFALTLVVGRLPIQEKYDLDTNYCQYTQGVLFTHGVIHGRSEHFQSLSVHLNCMVDPLRTGYASKYPPGYSGLIAIGLFLGADTLINPVCGAVTLWLMLLLLREHYGKGTTLFWGALLSLVSTYFIYMSAEFWNHPSALMSCTLIVWAAFQRTALGWGRAVVIILSLTYCSLTRPLSSIAMTVFLGSVVVVRWWCQPEARREASRLLGVTVLGALSGGVAFGTYNYFLTGDFFLSGYEALHGASHNPGFHVDPYGRHFTLWEGLKDLAVRWRSMNRWLFMWPIPSLSLFGVWLVSFKKWRSFDGVCALWIMVQSLIYCFMWSAGQVPVGPRFLYEALPAILILSARGLSIVEEALGAGKWGRVGLIACVVGLSLCGFSRYMEWARDMYQTVK